jgi:DNA (cytosine-5)-methyltransferase 1
MTKYKEWNLNESIDLLVGGTPCQSFSVAGLRKGLEDPRGNLMLTYVGILDKFRPKWCIWENVPGVLSSNGGRDFGAFLGALGELGYGWSYRVLDAQHFGVPQRRRRVFVVGCLGDWTSPAKVLFESESLLGNSKTGRSKKQNSSASATSSTEISS